MKNSYGRVHRVDCYAWGKYDRLKFSSGNADIERLATPARTRREPISKPRRARCGGISPDPRGEVRDKSHFP